MKRFVLQTAQLCGVFGLIYLTMVWLASVPWLFEHKGLYNYLYAYQVDKIKSRDDINTVFVGDSALGNGLDADLFSELSGKKTLNVALTGPFGYAGSYNMIKKTHRYNPQLKNVIVMHTIEMPARMVSYRGYSRTITTMEDITELSAGDLKVVLLDLLNLHDIQLARDHQLDDLIANDFIRQARDWDFTGKEVAIKADLVNPDKNHFLKRIIRYCESHDLNLIYCHGPYFDKTLELSTGYIAAANQQLAATGIPLIAQTIPVPNEKLGDSEDHVKPANKAEYTRLYLDLLKPLLK